MRSRLRAALVAAALALSVAACGDGIVFISFTAGTIVANPICGAGTGQFDLLDQGGLTLLVVINGGTQIVQANGQPGTCTDLATDAHVQVRGPQSGTTITAQSVRVQ